MLIELRKDDSRPVYQQIAGEVERLIAVGVLRAGDRLPPSRQLAGELHVNTNTVQHAYRALTFSGAIAMRKGLGAFVAPTRENRARQGSIARQIAETALREAFRQGLLASDVIKALQDIAPRAGG